MVMLPGEYDIEIPRGGTFELPLTLTDQTGAVDFEATYDGARMQIRPALLHVPDPADPAGVPLYELTTTNAMLVFDTTTLYIRLTAAETAALPFKSGKYDIELYSGIDEAEIVDKLQFGKVSVIGEVTVVVPD